MREIRVPPERLRRWVDRFVERHGACQLRWQADVAGAHRLTLTAADGAVTAVDVPFPPLRPAPVPGEDGTAAVDRLVAHAAVDRPVAVVLVRRGGFAVAAAYGERLLASKVGGRHVQGRTAAGGWSQQRYARRREGQTRDSLGAAADEAARVVLPWLAPDRPDRPLALAAGGDRVLLGQLLADPRLAALAELPRIALGHVEDPRRDVLEDAVARARAVRLLLQEPEGT